MLDLQDTRFEHSRPIHLYVRKTTHVKMAEMRVGVFYYSCFISTFSMLNETQICVYVGARNGEI